MGTSKLSPGHAAPTALADRPAAPRFYYGYLMAGVSIAGIVATAPGQTFLVSVFNTAIAESLQLTQAQLSTAYMIGTLLASLPLTFVGRVSDRLGTRLTMGIAALLFGLACMLIGHANGLAALTLGFFSLRFFGQGSLGLISGHVMAMWFERKLGRLDGLRHALFSAAAAALPIPVLMLIESQGWGRTYAILGLAVWLLVLPLVLTVFRNKPEDVGQCLDGDAPEAVSPPPARLGADDATLAEEQAATIAVIEQDNDALHATVWKHEDEVLAPAPAAAVAGYTLREAMRTLPYWTLAISMVLLALIATGIMFHIQPMVLSTGMSEKQAAWLVSIWGGTSMFATPLAGFLADRFAPRRLVATGLVLLAIAPLVLTMATSFAVAATALVCMALAHSLMVTSIVSTMARYFGRAHHGSIRGSTATMGVAGTSIGPVILGLSNDYLATYAPGLILCSLLCVPLIVIALTLSPPKLAE